MKKILLSLLMTMQLSVPAYAEVSSAIGDWQGALDVAGKKLVMILHISQKDGKLEATMDSPAHGKYGALWSALRRSSWDLLRRLKSGS